MGTAKSRSQRRQGHERARAAWFVGVGLAFHVTVVRSEECREPVERQCGDGVRLITAWRTLALDIGTERVARNEEEWQELWRFFALPAPPPSVHFEREYVVARVEFPTCVPSVPVARLCADGRVELSIRQVEDYGVCMSQVEFSSDARWVWVIAVSRASPSPASPPSPHPSTEDGEAPLLPCEAELTEQDLLARRLRPGRERHSPPDVLWHAYAGGLAGISSAGNAVAGFELRGGVRHDLAWSGQSDNVVGSLIGLDLRARWLAAPGNPENLFLVGLWPWLMTPRDWIFHRAGSRAPVLLGVIVPEGGLVITSSGSVGGYLGWSFPLAFRLQQYFYRTSPYLLNEHWLFELAPGALVFFGDRGTSGLFTLTMSAGLW